MQGKGMRERCGYRAGDGTVCSDLGGGRDSGGWVHWLVDLISQTIHWRY